MQETLETLKDLANNLDLTEVKEVRNFISLCELLDSSGKIYLRGLKRIYLEKIEKIEELEQNELSNKDFGYLNPMYRYPKIRIYLAALEGVN